MNIPVRHNVIHRWEHPSGSVFITIFSDVSVGFFYRVPGTDFVDVGNMPPSIWMVQTKETKYRVIGRYG